MPSRPYIDKFGALEARSGITAAAHIKLPREYQAKPS